VIFIKTKRGLINAECIIRIRSMDDADNVLVEYRTAMPVDENSDHRHATTFAPIAEMEKLGLKPEDFDYLATSTPIY